MKKIFNIHSFLSITLLIILLSACKRDEGDVMLQPRNERDVVEVMQRETKGDFTMFLEALEVTGIGKQLRVEANQNPSKRYIVFAPTNKAFGALLLQLGTPSVAQTDITVLTETVKAHIHELPNAEKNIKLEDLTEGDYKTLQAGRDIYVNFDCDGNPYLNGKTIVAFERASKNGYVYGIEDVIFQPTSTIAEILNSDPDLSVLNQLVNKAGLAGVFADASKSYTLLAPSNAALFDVGLDPATFDTPEEIAFLDSVLRYHVIGGRVFALSVCTEKPYVSLLGQDIQIDVDGVVGGRFNDFVEFVEQNAHFAKNGVIHKVDYPILPSTLNIRQRIAQLSENPANLNNSFSIAKQALALTGLDVELEKASRVTVLLPNDAAFISFLSLNNYASIYAMPVDKLTEILRYHVITKRMFFLDLSPASGDLVVVKSLQGEDISTPRRTQTTAGTSAAALATLTEYVGVASYYNDPTGRIDMKLTNGNIHCVRKVYVPKAVNLKQVP